MRRHTKFVGALIALLMLGGLFAFAVPEAQAYGEYSSRVRVAHLSPDAPAVDIYVNGNKTLSSVSFKTVSDYLTVKSGFYNFAIRVAGAQANSKPVLSTDTYLAPGRDYTVAAVNFLAHIQAKIYKDDNNAPAFGNARVKVVHASPDAPAVDVAVKNGPVLVSNLSFRNASDDFQVRSGSYDLDVRVAGTPTVALPLPGVNFEAGKVYTVFAVDKLAKISVVVTAVAGKIDPEKTSRVRVAHLSPDAPAVDIYVNGTKALSNVTFKTVSDYLSVPSGKYQFQVRVAGTAANSPAVIDVTTILRPETDYTVAAINFLAHIQGKIYRDNNRAPQKGEARVRVIHASPDAPAVDIAPKGGQPLIRNLSFSEASRYLSLKAGSYDLEVRVAGTSTVALSLPGVKLEAGKVYTVFAVDKVANLGVVVTAVPGKNIDDR